MHNKMNETEKKKNLKDLEYNHILSKQNIALVLVGTAVLYAVFTENLPINVSRGNLILLLVLIGIMFLWYFGKQLNDVKNDIKKL